MVRGSRQAISGTRRKVPAGMPGTPVCQEGLANNELTPPPVEEKLPPFAMEKVVSFHAISGM